MDDQLDPDRPSEGRTGRRASRRQLFVAAAGVVGAAVTARSLGGGFASGGGSIGASGLPLTGAAEASEAAVRLGPPPVVLERPRAGRIAFPIDPAARSYALDNYGDCRGGGSRAHIGVDIISERGAPVFAVDDGQLTRAFENTGTAGWGWAMRDADGGVFRYFHLDSLEDGLEPGDSVRFGQVLGYVGSTGNFITGPDGERIEDRNNIHLHFEYWPSPGVTVDPLPLLELPGDVSVGPPLKSCLSRA